MSVIRELEPKNVWKYFDDICAIPHGSGNTQAISDYCVSFAEEHGLKCRQEDCGNVIIWKPASPGYEGSETVMLQGHMDMVAVKTEDCEADLTAEGLRPVVSEDGKWVYAKGTSLGGDDGIALAYALGFLADVTLPHPPLEAVFSVDEEIGLLGAAALDASDLNSRILLNMDSEDDGIFLTSCAGGATFTASVPVARVKKTGVVYEWKVSGLKGGHSGAEIHLGRANANLLFGRFLAQVGAKAEFYVGDFSGGEKDNAIPNQCRAILVVSDERRKEPRKSGECAETGNFGEMIDIAGQPQESQEDKAVILEQAAAAFAETIRAEYAAVEPDLLMTLTRLSDHDSEMVAAEEGRNAITVLLEHFPSGVLRMMPEIPDMVQTSLNLGVLRLGETEASMTFSVRSASATEKEWLLTRMKDLTVLAGGRFEISGEYPAWEYKPGSRIQQIMSETYEEITGKKPVFTGIHAGVECGLISEKIPGIDCISYGPQMRDIHTTRERLNIESVKKNYELTVRTLEKLQRP